MPGSNLDIVHAGVVLQLEVHDVVVSGRVAVIIEHHHLGHVAELEVVEVLLQSAGVRISAANRLIGEVVQSRRRPLLGPSPS